MESCKSLKNNALTLHHHYPYGMMMPDRDWSSESGYRFGFGGHESDFELEHQASYVTGQYWEYNSMLGVRWNLDPMKDKYADQSPYNVFARNPILLVDPKGDTIRIYMNDGGKNTLLVKVATAYDIDFEVALNQLPDEISSMIRGSDIKPITIDNQDIVNLFSFDPGKYSADAKMASLTLGVGVLIAGQVELDIVNINKGKDAGKTFLYFSTGIGFGAAMPDLNYVIGKVDYNPDDLSIVDKYSPIDADLFNGWSFQTTYSAGAPATQVVSYGSSDPACFFGACDDPKLYSAKLHGPSFTKRPLKNVGNTINPSLGIMRTASYSTLLGELPIEE